MTVTSALANRGRTPPETTTKKTIDQLADEVLAGKWDNGAERERLLTAAGYDYNAV